MEVIIGLRPACRASLPNRHTPIKPTFRFPSPVEIVDLLSPANRVFNITFRAQRTFAVRRNGRPYAELSCVLSFRGERLWVT